MIHKKLLLHPKTSIVDRLTIWYAFSLSLLLLCSLFFLYSSMKAFLQAEATSLLRDRSQAIASVLERTNPIPSIRRRVEREWALRNEKIYVRIIDLPNSVIAQSPGIPERLLERMATLSGSKNPTQDDSSLSLGKEKYMYYASWVNARNGHYLMQLGYNYASERNIIANYRTRLIWTLISTLLICVIISRRLATAAFAPVESISESMRQISYDDLSKRIHEALPLELRTIGLRFNEMIDRLREPIERLSQFSADIAHELRTPINNIRGEIEVALYHNRSPEEYREVLSSTLEETDRVGRLIENLLFLVRTENPEAEIKREEIDLSKELRIISDYFESNASEASITIHCALENKLSVHAERTLFQRAVSNLITNAIRATPPGGKIEISAWSKADQTHIVVSDTGIGISREKLPHILDRLYRVDRARTTNVYTGSGLGLSLVKGIMKLHQGSVQIESELNHGTRAVLIFPKQ